MIIVALIEDEPVESLSLDLEALDRKVERGVKRYPQYRVLVFFWTYKSRLSYTHAPEKEFLSAYSFFAGRPGPLGWVLRLNTTLKLWRRHPK
jgi:hypothetical protein